MGFLLDQGNDFPQARCQFGGSFSKSRKAFSFGSHRLRGVHKAPMKTLPPTGKEGAMLFRVIADGDDDVELLAGVSGNVLRELAG
jgi:hypothetical protein